MKNGWWRVKYLAVLCAAMGTALIGGGSPACAQENDESAKEEARSAAEIRARYTKFEFRIPMRDGAKLFTSVYMPKDASSGKTYPFLMERTPYSVEPYGADNYAKHLGPAASFVADGFIFVYQDVRGRYQSEGTWIEMTPHKDVKKGPNDVDESTDTYDTIEWLLKNVPNNNGKAGIYGISYPGFYAVAGMVDSHPALKACSPQAPVTDLYMGDDAYHNGAFMLDANFGFYVYFKPRVAMEFPKNDWGSFNYGTNDGYDFYLTMGPLSNANTHLKNVHCAVMVVGGLFDAEDLQGPYKIFRSVAAMSPGTPDHIVEGPWVHGGWAFTKGDHLGPVNFAADNSAYFNDQVLLPFFQQYLKDAGDAKLPTALIFETGTNVWRRYDTWPPKGTQTKTLYFEAGGKLSFGGAKGTSGYDEYVSDPARPVPFVETQSTSVPQTYMDADQRFVAKRTDVETYQTEPLEEDVTVAGAVSPKLWVSSSGTDSDFVVKLIDVYPMDYPNPEPNPKDIMVQIQSSWFPLVDRNPQKFVNIPDAKAEDFQKATQRVYRGGEHASALVLPVMK